MKITDIIENEQKVLVTNIQRFSLHDGPGIRTTVFTKGCSLKCPWCCNPENISKHPESYYSKDEKGTYGEYKTCDELYQYILKDEKYYGKYMNDYSCIDENDLTIFDNLPGGVTFSGGEAILQISKIEYLLRKLKDNHIHTCIETSLFVPEEKLKFALKYMDLFYVDIKILDKDKCESILGGNLNLYFNNLHILFEAKKMVVFRIPVIAGYTDDMRNQNNVLNLLKQYRPVKVELIKEHNLGINKYISLSQTPPEYKGVSDNLMQVYKKEILAMNIAVEICQI